MKSRKLWLVIVGAALVTALVAGFDARPRAAGVSCKGVPTSGDTTYNPLSCTVNCAAGGTITSAIALAPRTTGGLTITIEGNCTQTIDDLGYGGITMQGGSSGGTIQAPSSSTDPVVRMRGRGNTLSNLTIKGGVVALEGIGAGFTGNNLTIEGASSANVYLLHTGATLNNSTVENAAADGIDAYADSALFLNGGAVQGNANWGVEVAEDSSISINDGAILQDNGGYGALAAFGGFIDLIDGVIQNNHGEAGLSAQSEGSVRMSGSGSIVTSNLNGVQVRGGGVSVQNGAIVRQNTDDGIVIDGGHAILQSGGIVEGNGGDGVHVDIGDVNVGGGSGPATIESNKGNGIFLRTNGVALFGNAANQIVNNSGWGILCTGAPSNPLILGAIGTVSGNGKGQISCKVSP